LLYAYVNDETALDYGETIQKDNHEYIVIKSIDVLKRNIKKEYEYYCLSCHEQVFFRHYKDKHDHFYHRGSSDCKIPESIEHLLVKMEIYKYLKLAGYEAKLETPFFRNGLSVRADVFARSGVYQLVVEVQASSSIRLDTIRRRNTIYAASGIPTAWIIVLDSFLGRQSKKITMNI
jgi:competence CoiA-like predicted nuclease